MVAMQGFRHILLACACVLYVEVRLRVLNVPSSPSVCTNEKGGADRRSRASTEGPAETKTDWAAMGFQPLDFSLYEENEDYRQAYHPGSVNLFSPFTDNFRAQKAALDDVSQKLAALEQRLTTHVDAVNVAAPQPVVRPDIETQARSSPTGRGLSDVLVRAAMVILILIHAWHLKPALKDVALSALRSLRSPASIAAA